MNEAAFHLTEQGTLPGVPEAIPAAMPIFIEPMKAVLVEKAFSHAEWLFETKWDGVRAVCFIENGVGRLMSRNQLDITARYPELELLAEWVNASQAVIDGEIVSLDEEGLPSFQRLQARLGLEQRSEIVALAKSHPVVYYAFDLLYYNGFNLMPAELLHRKSLLEEIIEINDILRYSEHVVEDGTSFYQRMRRAGMEGMIAKYGASAYLQKRSDRWLKVKTQQRQEVVIGGYTKPQGGRRYFGALVVGLYDRGDLQYVGHVRGGFNAEMLKNTYQVLKSRRTSRSPFASTPRTNQPVQWVEPHLVGDVKFTEWTRDRRLRQPIFLGLRDDKEPAECVFESPVQPDI
jgi:bifunctional non-homologous end joining protein LigD